MAFTLRLSDEDEALAAAAAQREGVSKNELVAKAIRAYTQGRAQRLDSAIERVALRDAAILDELAK